MIKQPSAFSKPLQLSTHQEPLQLFEKPTRKIYYWNHSQYQRCALMENFQFISCRFRSKPPAVRLWQAIVFLMQFDFRLPLIRQSFTGFHQNVSSLIFHLFFSLPFYPRHCTDYDNKTCVPCEANCASCQDRPDYCTSCEHNLVMHEHKCYSACPVHTYETEDYQ